MLLVKDLGITDLGGTLTKVRHYYQMKCEKCNRLVIKRKDQSDQEFCVYCTRKNQAIEKRKLAQEILNFGFKECTKCKQTKEITLFGIKKNSLVGHRSICKECRFKHEQETNKAYRKTEKGKMVSANCQGRRRQQKLVKGNTDITSDALILLKQKQNNLCYHCHNSLDYNTPKATHLDHLIPLSKGGLHVLSNVVWSCASCNLKKNNNLVI